MSNYSQSRHAKVSISGNFITGLQSFRYTRSDNDKRLAALQSTVAKAYISENPEINLDLSWIDSQYSISYFLFNTGVLTDHITKKYNILYEDNQGKSWISGCYLNRYQLSAAVDQPINITTSYEADETDLINNISTEPDFDDAFEIYNASLITISGNFPESINTTGMCLDSVNFSISAERRPIVRLGDTIPQTRLPILPIEVTLNASVKRDGEMINQIANRLDNNVFLPSGAFNITIEDFDGNSVTHFLPTVVLDSVEESLSVGDNHAITTLNYKGTMTTGDYRVVLA